MNVEKRFIVFEINKDSGWIMFVSESDFSGFSFSHNPMHARIFTKENADEFIEAFLMFKSKTACNYKKNYILAKVQIG